MFLKIDLIFFQMGFSFSKIYSMCICGFIEKNINVCRLYKHSNVPKKIQYGHYLL
jgi:hypothetical protein